ncbi:hypothetical protein [Aquimarina sp. MAR_2010_214]|uniref:hypothetical protein n=1 Tax=Aquimarina sp. MAR_2010_214 TaxID=1250026 RepID=UPI001177BFF7|nr:hypothetical protein [Aquimarina sp. MAR_2010_214]
MKKLFQIMLFLRKNSILFILLIISSCSSQFDFNEVASGKLIPKKENIVYNRESIKKIGNNIIFIKKIERYNKGLDLLEVDIAKAESMLTYSRKELEDDSVLIDSYKISRDRTKTIIENDFIIDNGEKYKIIYKVKDSILCLKEKNVLLLIKSRN